MMTDNILDILRRAGIEDEKIDAVRKIAPWLIPRDWDAIKAAIKADPCRKWQIVARRHKVSKATVYRVWNLT